ncbi:hypothetical protein PB1_11469 [Bacillus methanolicus PB1]|uniref:YgiT-type zinc finger protein n=1 Tax=Bacillus methanolicus PB1 TaxID=997296 RepID=I3DVA5_BACMT|nr:hypothetical protein [Bacillus methanolicus]EIJ78176.1 hypothetical protein PB1_11469 [Bacillus methanolicus PB1]
MIEVKNCKHLFSNSNENYVFTTDDGIEVFVTGAAYQKCMSCGHAEFPLETKELIESSLKEKRISKSNQQLYINLIDLL